MVNKGLETFAHSVPHDLRAPLRLIDGLIELRQKNAEMVPGKPDLQHLTALSEHKNANEVAVAPDGMEALDYLYRRGSFSGRPSGNPVVIMLDLKMPRMDGVQVLRQIKTDEQLHLIPVVILTSSRESLDLHACYQLGVNAYVVKPVRFVEFVDAVKNTGVFWALINHPPIDNTCRQ